MPLADLPYIGLNTVDTAGGAIASGVPSHAPSPHHQVYSSDLDADSDDEEDQATPERRRQTLRRIQQADRLRRISSRGYTYRALRWIRRRLLLIIIMLASSAIVLLHLTLRPIWLSKRMPRFGGLHRWEAFAIPGLVMFALLTCGLLARCILCLLDLVRARPRWFMRILRDSFHEYLAAIIFFITVDTVICNWWLDRIDAGAAPTIAYVKSFVTACYWILLLWVCKTIVVKIVERHVTSRQFRDNVDDMTYCDLIVDHLCCVHDMSRDAFLSGYREYRRQVFMDRVACVRDLNCSVRLQPINHGIWRFPSGEERIELSSQKEFRKAGEAIYSYIMRHSSNPTLTLDYWHTLFPANTLDLAERAFYVLFGFGDKQTRLTRTDFADAVVRFGKKRMELKGHLFGMQNLFALVNTTTTVIVVLCIVIFFISFVFNIELKEIIIGMSSVMLSIAFATSKSMQRAFESALFILASRPFQINDVVEVNGEIYRVHQIGFLETRFKDLTNRVTRLSNLVLSDAKIVNLGFGDHKAIVRIDLHVAINTPAEVIEAFRASLSTYATMNSASWQQITLICLNIQQCNSLQLLLKADTRFTWTQTRQINAARSALCTFVADQIAILGIRHEQPVQPIRVDDTQQLLSAPLGSAMRHRISLSQS